VRRMLGVSLGLFLIAAAPAGAAPARPSFSCARATSFAERTICSDPELAALDRQLDSTYQNMSGQGGVGMRP